MYPHPPKINILFIWSLKNKNWRECQFLVLELDQIEPASHSAYILSVIELNLFNYFLSWVQVHDPQHLPSLLHLHPSLQQWQPQLVSHFFLKIDNRHDLFGEHCLS